MPQGGFFLTHTVYTEVRRCMSTNKHVRFMTSPSVTLKRICTVRIGVTSTSAIFRRRAADEAATLLDQVKWSLVAAQRRDLRCRNLCRNLSTHIVRAERNFPRRRRQRWRQIVCKPACRHCRAPSCCRWSITIHAGCQFITNDTMHTNGIRQRHVRPRARYVISCYCCLRSEASSQRLFAELSLRLWRTTTPCFIAIARHY